MKMYVNINNLGRPERLREPVNPDAWNCLLLTALKSIYTQKRYSCVWKMNDLVWQGPFQQLRGWGRPLPLKACCFSAVLGVEDGRRKKKKKKMDRL